MSKTSNSNWVDTAVSDTLPLRAQERLWGFLDMLWVQSGLAIGTWSFLIGGVTATFVGFWDGIWTMLLGNSIGVIPMLLATALPANKWGTEHYISQRTIYGPLGVMFNILSISLIGIGWITILAVMFGESTAKVMGELFGVGASTKMLINIAVALASIGIGWVVTVKGDVAIGKLSRYVAPGLILMSAAMLLAIFSQRSWLEISAAPALAAHGDRASNIMLAIELNIAAGMSWWSLAANVSRSARTQRIALWAGYIGYVPVAVLAQSVGLTAALVMGSSDPTDWILPIVGPIAGVALLIFIGFANLTSLSGVAYASVQTAAQHFGPRIQQFGWARTAGLLSAFCAACVFVSGTLLYGQFFVFAAWSQAILAPAIGISLADYYVLRRKQFSLEGLYAIDASGMYYFWHRVNFAALASLGVGGGVYVLIFNPATLAPAGVFSYFTASIPAMVAAMATHLLLAKLVVIPAGKGGYPSSRWRHVQRISYPDSSVTHGGSSSVD